MADATTTRRRRADAAVDAIVQPAPAQKAAAKPVEGPQMAPAFAAIVETVFEIPDPEAEYAHLEKAIRLDDALAPAALQAALNDAESNALRASRLYIVARSDFERFEAANGAILEGMRDAANRELQAEKDAKQRSKAITNDDINGRASVLFPDEWGAVNDRKSKAAGMLDHLKALANLWTQRCYSIGTMLNAGKRG